MDRRSFQFRIPVQRTGCIASRTLSGATAGRIAAVFDSSFYIETEAGLVCIGNTDLEPGPLNLATCAPPTTKWSASGLQRNATAKIDRQAIGIGNRHYFSLTGAAEWSPDPRDGSWNIDKLASGIRAFREIAANRIPTEGLGRYLNPDFRPDHDQRVCRAAARPLSELRRWLLSAFREPDTINLEGLKQVHPLIGLGPGLTPSGDDLIGGMMIALHGLGEPGICRAFWLPTRHYAEQASNAISCAHLAAAAEGKGSAAIHRAFSAIADGDCDEMHSGLSGVARVGHTSGWDAIAGMILALDCWVEFRRTQSPS